MLLALDIGNSGISIGFFSLDSDVPRMAARARICTDLRRSIDEYRLLLRDLMRMYDVDPAQINAAAISSVVPSLTPTLSEAVRSFTDRAPLVIGPGVHTGLNIRIDHQVQIGADIVANTVAAVSRVPVPAVIVDLGTVTTIAVVDAQSSLIGAILCPGVRTSMEAMAQSAAQLNPQDLTRPEMLIGKNTADSINSGVVNGHIIMIDGFVREIRQSIPKDGEILSLIATGGLAERIIPHCRNKFTIIPSLTLLGIAEIYRRNAK